jgi:hypothetical protein
MPNPEMPKSDGFAPLHMRIKPRADPPGFDGYRSMHLDLMAAVAPS